MRAEVIRSAYRLRPFPNEDVYFHCKRIDNSRVVRVADPRAGGVCWSTIGAACLLIAALTSVLAPNVAGILAGYKLQALDHEERALLDERRVLELEEARLLSPARLEELAKAHQMVTPAPGQVVHLDPKTEGSLAMDTRTKQAQAR
jgi:hypothetical protein